MTDEKHHGTTGGALDIKPEDVLPPGLTDSDLKGGDAGGNIAPDEPGLVHGKLDETVEGIRQRTDGLVSGTDLEDADIRHSTPGAREQP